MSDKKDSSIKREMDLSIIPPNKISTLDGFLRQFISQHKQRTDQPFCFILGAGASRDSGIPTGGEMASDWLKQLHEDRNHTSHTLEQWVKDGNLGINGFDLKVPARHYSQIYELLYKDKEQAGFSYLESIMDGKEPSFGYSVLSYLLSETQHRIVITTNFDNLVTDALAIHSGTFPIVVNDDSLAHYVRANVNRPLVAKIHGSLGFKPKSRENELKLDDGWCKALAAIFQTHIPVVIGYDGNDGSLMKLLEEGMANCHPSFIWWCYLCQQGEDPWKKALNQPERVRKLVLSRPAEFVPIPGFDLLMLKLLTVLEKDCPKVPDLVVRLEERSSKRLADYKKQREELGTRLTQKAEKRGGNVPAPLVPAAAVEVALLARGASEKPWWQWQNEIDDAPNFNQMDDLYRKAIESLPESIELLGNYAIFLTDIRKDHDAAEALYKRSIEADPKNSNNLGNYALFLTDIRKDHDAAEALYKRSIEADPKKANILGAYAFFLKSIRGNYDVAEALHRRSIEADPKNSDNLANYANFLTDIRKDHDGAEALYKRSIEADPKNSNILGNYAVFLKNIRRDYDAAEGFYKRSIEADPKNSSILGNYANFLTDIRKDHDAAEVLYKRSIEADTKNTNNLGNYAIFLTTTRKDYDAAEALYKRSIAVDPKNASTFNNYGQYLLGRGRNKEGLSILQKAWQNRLKHETETCAEIAYSIWLGTLVAEADGHVWERVFKALLLKSFSRHPWDFDDMLIQAEKAFKNEDFIYTKAMASAFLDESKMQELENFSRWKKLKPLDPDLINADGTVRKA